ncbi:Hypothetical protein A7982_00250 [Minicystis rosea]|nr:Hypothetical protein A7982_00250 [Minicystis rosea]
MRSVIPSCFLIGAGLAVACSSVPSNPGDTTSTSTGGSDGGGQSVSSTGVGFGGSLTTTGTGGPTGTCSSDLQAIVDDQGNILQMCPPEQGCAGGTCVPACSAAEQSKGSIGCDFWAPDPPFYSNGQGSTYDGTCYAVFIANTWSRPAQITVSRGGQTFDLKQFGRIPSGIVPNIAYDPIPATGVPPNQVAVLFLSHKPGAKHDLGSPLTCPVAPAYLDDAAVAGSGKGQAFHVVADTPVTAYDILPYGGAKSFLPSASLLFPATSWGTNYYAVAPHAAGGGLLWMLVASAADGNEITIAAPGQSQTMTYTLNAGETIQWTGADPTSTVLASTQPIGVFTGSTYLRVASQTSPSGGGQDSSHQQIPQIKALGSEYVAPGVVSRLASLAPESVPYRMLGVIDGTTLTYDPAPPPGAPSTLSAGQVVEFETTSLFVVRSQDDDHPFGLTQYMPGAPSSSRAGCGPEEPYPGAGACHLGDEDWVNLLAPKQFLQRYVFFTDPTYGTTNLVLTRVKGASGFSEVSIDCLGGDVTGWMDVDGAGKYQVAHVDLTRGASPIAQCTGSRHEATSKGQFGVMVWGTDFYASYGYPAGGNIGSINNVTVPPVPK